MAKITVYIYLKMSLFHFFTKLFIYMAVPGLSFSA